MEFIYKVIILIIILGIMYLFINKNNENFVSSQGVYIYNEDFKVYLKIDKDMTKISFTNTVQDATLFNLYKYGDYGYIIAYENKSLQIDINGNINGTSLDLHLLNSINIENYDGLLRYFTNMVNKAEYIQVNKLGFVKLLSIDNVEFVTEQYNGTPFKLIETNLI